MIIVATRKVTPGSEYAPEGPIAQPNLSSTPHATTHAVSHAHNTRSYYIIDNNGLK